MAGIGQGWCLVGLGDSHWSWPPGGVSF